MATAGSLGLLDGRGVATARSRYKRASGERGQLETGSLRPGVGDSFERERVSEIQRSRLLAAAGQVCCEYGAVNMTVAQIVQCAGVSRRTFYELYSDSEECLLDVFSDALARARECVLSAWSSQGDWRARTRCALTALLGLFDEDPVLARLLVVESLAVGPRMLADRARVLDGVIDALASAARQGASRGTDQECDHAGEAAARLSMEGALGGLLGVLHARISQRSSGHLSDLTSPLMSMLVLPYDGPAAARREAQRPAPAPSGGLHPGPRGPVFGPNPFKDAGMRLTYRTMRVLCAVEEQPGSSNRRIAALADIGDQAQASKLLSRLERGGMIANAAVGTGRGEANAWTITPAGRRVTHCVSTQVQQAGAVNTSDRLGSDDHIGRKK